MLTTAIEEAEAEEETEEDEIEDAAVAMDE
jgi:hypothetical protein